MNEIERRLREAKMLGLDPREVSPAGECFAWLPVRLTTGERRWLCRVRWFQPFRLFTEYYDVKKA